MSDRQPSQFTGVGGAMLLDSHGGGLGGQGRGSTSSQWKKDWGHGGGFKSENRIKNKVYESTVH